MKTAPDSVYNSTTFRVLFIIVHILMPIVAIIFAFDDDSVVFLAFMGYIPVMQSISGEPFKGNRKSYAFAVFTPYIILMLMAIALVFHFINKTWMLPNIIISILFAVVCLINLVAYLVKIKKEQQ